MSEHSTIEWTDATWNPVTGCTKISPGCKHCYAQTFAERFRGVPGHPFEQGFDLRVWPARLSLPLYWRQPKRIFVNSMSDLFHKAVSDDFIDKVFATMANAPWHQFQVLTKRAERMAHYVRRRYAQTTVPPHIWLGVSIETQQYLPRATELAGLQSEVRFLSCEPLLGPLDLKSVLGPSAVNWVIVGGESGAHSRPLDPSWVLEIRNQCISASVPFFFKQWGGRNKKAAGRLLENRTWDAMPVPISA
jgi:protein gp37